MCFHATSGPWESVHGPPGGAAGGRHCNGECKPAMSWSWRPGVLAGRLRVVGRAKRVAPVENLIELFLRQRSAAAPAGISATVAMDMIVGRQNSFGGLASEHVSSGPDQALDNYSSRIGTLQPPTEKTKKFFVDRGARCSITIHVVNTQSRPMWAHHATQVLVAAR